MGDHGEGLISLYLEVRGRLPKQDTYQLRYAGEGKKVDQQKRKSRKAEGTVCAKAGSRGRNRQMGRYLDTALRLSGTGDGR